MKKGVITAIIIAGAAVTLISAVAVILVLIAGSSGDITVDYNGESFTVHGPLVKDTVVNYSEIEKAELRKGLDTGSRVFGTGTAKISAGNFKNREFGVYKLYTYNSCDTYAVLHLKDGSVVVLGGENDASSVNIYRTLMSKISGNG